MALPNLRSIFASARTSDEERQLSRVTFYKFAAFVGSCVIISLLASHNSGVSSKDLRASRQITRTVFEESLKLV